MRHVVLANTAVLIGGLALLTPVAPASGQVAAASGCTVDQVNPKELAIAWLSFNKAKGAADAPTRATALKQVFKDLGEKVDKFAVNPAGYQYITSQALTLWALQPGMNYITTRGAIGYTTRPADPLDLIAELDTAYTKMAAAAPACASDIEQSRNSEVWFALTKRADDASTAGQYDTATYYAGRSLQLSPNNPFAHHVLGGIAVNQKDIPKATVHWKEVLRLVGSDTSYKDIRSTSLFYLGVNEFKAAESASGAEQKTRARAAANYLKEFLLDQPDGPDAPGIMSNLSVALEMAGDSAEVKTLYKDMVANPGKYNEFTLTAAGVIASRQKDLPAALALFQAVVATSPRSRDGLRNLAVTHLSLKQHDKMYAPLRDLLAIDPNNYDAWTLLALSEDGLSRSATAPADKKKWTDSVVKHSDFSEAMPARIDVRGFQRNSNAAEVSLTVIQSGEKPGQYSITVEFLDKAGAVVGEATQSVGPLAKGERKSVVFKGTGAGITAFRYKPLT